MIKQTIIALGMLGALMSTSHAEFVQRTTICISEEDSLANLDGVLQNMRGTKTLIEGEEAQKIIKNMNKLFDQTFEGTKVIIATFEPTPDLIYFTVIKKDGNTCEIDHVTVDEWTAMLAFKE